MRTKKIIKEKKKETLKYSNFFILFATNVNRNLKKNIIEHIQRAIFFFIFKSIVIYFLVVYSVIYFYENEDY